MLAEDLLFHVSSSVLYAFRNLESVLISMCVILSPQATVELESQTGMCSVYFSLPITPFCIFL